VQEAIKEGWQPFGGIAITQWEGKDGLTFLYVQAMVKTFDPSTALLKAVAGSERFSGR
jgi:hypothetical protein